MISARKNCGCRVSMIFLDILLLFRNGPLRKISSLAIPHFPRNIGRRPPYLIRERAKNQYRRESPLAPRKGNADIFKAPGRNPGIISWIQIPRGWSRSSNYPPRQSSGWCMGYLYPVYPIGWAIGHISATNGTNFDFRLRYPPRPTHRNG